MMEFMEVIGSINFTMIKVIGMIISGITGLIMSWVSKRSVNYKKIDKSVVISSLMFFVHLNVVMAIVTFFATIFILILEIEIFVWLMAFSIFLAAITTVIFLSVLRKSKRMKTMMARAKEISKRLYWMLIWVSVISIVINFVYLPYIILEQQNIVTTLIIYASWICTVWWFVLIISFIWRTAKYVYSEMKITLVDGDIIQYSCSPKMCRVHKNYLRLLTRDETGAIIYEKHINEGAIKQIEYS